MFHCMDGAPSFSASFHQWAFGLFPRVATVDLCVQVLSWVCWKLWLTSAGASFPFSVIRFSPLVSIQNLSLFQRYF